MRLFHKFPLKIVPSVTNELELLCANIPPPTISLAKVIVNGNIKQFLEIGLKKEENTLSCKVLFLHLLKKKTQKHLLCVCWLLEDMSCISYNYPDSCVPICHDFCLEVSGRTWLGFVKISWCHCRHEHT